MLISSVRHHLNRYKKVKMKTEAEIRAELEKAEFFHKNSQSDPFEPGYVQHLIDSLKWVLDIPEEE
jgi:hypothetical protein